MVYAPDFDYRVAEPYRANDVGQTEMMILKVRREIASKIHQLKFNDSDAPEPSKGKDLVPRFDADTLTTFEVARLLRVSQDTVRRLGERGELFFQTTPGGHRRFRRDTVEDYILKNYRHEKEV